MRFKDWREFQVTQQLGELLGLALVAGSPRCPTLATPYTEPEYKIPG